MPENKDKKIKREHGLVKKINRTISPNATD